MNYQCYKLHSEKLDHDMAQYQCQCTGGYTLANIPSAEVNTFLTSLVGTEEAWIGLNDKATEGTYVWSDGSALGSYKNWKTNQPSSDSSTREAQDCAKIDGDAAGVWDDVLCSKTLVYICESGVPSTTTLPASTCTTPTTTTATTVAPVTASPTETCETGWFHYAAGNKCVKLFSDAEVTWDEARVNCHCQAGGDLISITSSEENAWLMANPLLGKTDTQMFIGLNDLVVEGEYKWADGTTQFYRNWFTNRPNDAADSATITDCGSLRYQDGKWDDVDCTSKKHYICQYPERSSSSTSSTATYSASSVCSCETGWVGNVDTGACYKFSGPGSVVNSYSEADTACKVNNMTSSLPSCPLSHCYTTSGPWSQRDQHHLRRGERLRLEQLRARGQHLAGRN